MCCQYQGLHIIYSTFQYKITPLTMKLQHVLNFQIMVLTASSFKGVCILQKLLRPWRTLVSQFLCLLMKK